MTTISSVRLLVDGPQPGAVNMATDEVLMGAGSEGAVTLRLYRWEPGCLSFGRNQEARDRYDGDRAEEMGYEVVRRPTGGRSVLHHRELTYSVVAPASWGPLKEVYVRINRSLAAGLRQLGIDAEVQERGRGPIPRPTVRACFRDPLPGEVTAAGRKLIGSAQWRFGGALLQHGSILLHNDQYVVEQLRIGAPPSPDVPAVGIAELLEDEPEPAELERAIVSGFEAELRATLVPDELTADELAGVQQRRGHYEDPAWTWRR